MNKFQTFHISLNQNIDYQDGSVVSREVFRDKFGTLTLFAFDQGQELSEHKTPFNAFVYVIDGEAEIFISGKSNIVKAGELIQMPAEKPHAIKANKKFRMLLIMMKS